jgi:D-alanyl-D-alanine carboxypeptidase/D-alanyl-D-alanine-endopeptidase (penicillin-binding protein 4)
MSLGRAFVTLTLLTAYLAAPERAAADELAKQIDEVVGRPEYAHSRWGILIVDAKSGKTIYEREAGRLFFPASTAKLFTCATALAELGPDFRFVTPVYRRGEVDDGVLRGDLILVASGDLTFGGRTGKDGKTLFTNGDHTYANAGLPETALTDSDPLAALDDLARQVRKQGITDVRGDVLIDDRLFQRSRGTGTGPDVVSPILVNDNVLDIIITPGKKPGDLASVRMRPETKFFVMDAEVKTGEADGPTRITLESTGPTHFAVRGRIPAEGKPALRIVTVDEPALFARALFIEALRRQGIRVAAFLHRPARFDVPDTAALAKMPRVAQYTSAPFAETVAVTLKVSNNLYASTMPLLVAARHGGRSLEQGMRRQGEFLKEIGVPAETICLSGGAGGESADSLTPAATVKLLQVVAKRPEAEAFFGGLPVLGVDGTLAEAVAADSPAKGKGRAKTGTLIWYDRMNERPLLRAKCLAGEMETAKGSRLYFAIFLNDVALPSGAPASREGKVLGKLCEIMYQHGP